MGPMVKAEFRKTFTTNLWWALLIPAALIGFGSGWMGSTFAGIINSFEPLDRPVPLALLSVAASTNFSTIFGALFGALSVAGEYRHKTITTSFLTANPRGAVLVAKLVVAAAVGAGYGVITVLSAGLGALIGVSQGFGGFGDLGDCLGVAGACVLSMVLWTLLGVGFGALVANAVLAVILPLVYKFVVEFILSMALAGSDGSAVSPYLPGAAGNGIVSNLAVPLFIAGVAGPDEPDVPRAAFEILHLFFGGDYGHAWWASLLTFLAYTAVFVAGGWWASQRRDVA